MKKVFLTILAVVSMTALVCSCEKDNKNNGKQNNVDDTSELVTIDGKFTDWAALKDVAVSEVPDGLESYCNMLVMKATADADNVYLYFEYQLAEDQLEAPFDIFFNADGNAGTGFVSWIWSKEGCGWDYLLETEGGILVDGTGIADLSDMNIYMAETYMGADEATGEQVQLDGWASGAKQKKLELKDFAEAKGEVKNGVAMFEVAILRSVINATKKGNVGIGITISDAGWNTMGILPIDETGVGTAEFLQVALP